MGTKLNLEEEMKKSVAKINGIGDGSMTGAKQSDIANYMMSMKDRIAAVLPKHLSPERMIHISATLVSRNKQIAQCSAASILGGVMQASILGFPPVDAFGYCYFVPYGKELQFQIGYRGYIDLARRSGQIKDIYAAVVREGEVFNVTLGLHRDLVHVPQFDSTKTMTHVYAVAVFNDGSSSFEVLSKSDIERLRMHSPMQKGAPTGAWKTDYEAMAKAKALKQLSKYLPLNLDATNAIQSDGAIIKPENFENGEYKVEEAVYEQIDEATGEITNSSEETINNDLFNQTNE